MAGLPQFHMQDREGVALLIERRPFNHIETHMLIKAECPGILFVYIHALYVQVINFSLD